MAEFWEDDPPEEYADRVDEPKAVSAQRYQEEEPEEDEEEIDKKLMQDVDSRLEIAGLYRQFLSGSLFDENSVAANVVQRRIRSFVKSELEELVGLGSKRPDSKRGSTPLDVFSENEVKALKALAAKVLKIDGKPSPEGPQLRKIQTQPAPEPPKLVKASVTPPAAAVKPAPPQEKPKAPAKKPSSFQARRQAQPDELIEEAEDPETGARYKIERKNGRIIKKFFDKNGRPMLRAGDRKPIVQDLTPQVRPTSAIPMPGQRGIEAAMENMANASVNAGLANHTGTPDKFNSALGQHLAATMLRS